jgi:hypothetical protein
MRPNPYFLHGFKYATLTLLVIVLGVGGVAYFRTFSGNTITGRLVSPQQGGTIPTVHYDAQRSIDGFSLPADTHVIFTVPSGVRIPRITFFGGPDIDQERYWGYCFSGNENANKAAGKIGKAMYDGKFFYSSGERKAQAARPVPADSDLLGISQSNKQKDPEVKASIAEIFNGDDTCYVMSSAILPAGIDNDNDDVNNEREWVLDTDPNYPDTDNDGIPDGKEAFVTKTNPLDPDTDHDGLTDGCEDANQNGQVDQGETSALVADTDRDGLCDGDGWASGCPETKQQYCEPSGVTTGSGDALTCHWAMTSPVFGEDMNQNCQVDQKDFETDPTNPETFGIPDWEYKWRKLETQTGNRPAPEFPIPNLPVNTD